MRLFFLLFFFLSAQVFGEFAITSQNLDQNLAQHIHYSDKGPNYVGHIYIGGHDTQISQGTFIYVKKALESYKALSPIFIILELDTPGGEVFAAQKISDLLKEMDIQNGIPILAFINNWAISAGAMLAYSCRYITVVKDASMGAAQPITQTGEKTSEKVNSAIRTDFANRAAFFDRNPLIAEAMVDPDLTLVVRGGQIIKLESPDKIQKEDTVLTVKGKLLTLNSKEMLDLGVADIRLFPEKLTQITHQEKTAGNWPASKELLFTYPFFQKIPNAVVTSFKMDWKTRFFMFLASPLITSLLFLGLIVSFYIEFSTPGFGAFGVLGIICLFLLILSSFAIQTSAYLEFILLGVGIILIFIEIFVIPGLWIAGTIGAILALAGLLGLLLPGIGKIHYDFDTHTLNAAGQYVFTRIVWLSGAVVVGVIVIALLARFLAPKFRKFSPLVLKGEQVGYTSGLAKEDLPEVGAEGLVISPLRPAGKVEIENELFDAISSGRFIDKGEKIKVIRVEGSKLVVEEI